MFQVTHLIERADFSWFLVQSTDGEIGWLSEEAHEVGVGESGRVLVGEGAHDCQEHPI